MDRNPASCVSGYGTRKGVIDLNDRKMSKFLDTLFGAFNLFGLVSMVAQNFIMAALCFVLAAVAAALYFYRYKDYSLKDAIWMGVFWIMFACTILCLFVTFAVRWTWVFVSIACFLGCCAIVEEGLVPMKADDEDDQQEEGDDQDEDH